MASGARVWDAIIVGAGIAGSACASRLLAAGMDCLVLEAGPAEDGALPRSFGQKLRGKLDPRLAPPKPGRWPGPLTLSRDGRRYHPAAAVLGTGPGGGSRVYGAALARFERDDLTLHRGLAQWGGAPVEGLLPNAWPIAPEDLEPWYVAAEAALVGASPRPVGNGEIRPLPPLSPRDAALIEAMRAGGLNPERLQVGVNYLPGCTECQGVVCTRPCRRNAWDIFTSGYRAPQLQLEAGCKVQRITRAGGVYEVHCGTGAAAPRFRAARVVLAAGALNSPLVLARSADLWPGGAAPEMIGRGLMFHISDIFMLTVPGNPPAHGARKTIRITDFLEHDGVPYGEIQSLAVDATMALTVDHLRNVAMSMGLERLAPLAELARLAAPVLGAELADATLFATIVEDLPAYGNRVSESARAPDEIRITYRIAPELAERCRKLREMIVNRLPQLAPRFATRVPGPNLGHPIGTCRMGSDPALSVVDRDGGVWDQPQLFVCDAAVLPSSARTNPGLTVAANALRVGEAIARNAGAGAGALSGRGLAQPA